MPGIAAKLPISLDEQVCPAVGFKPRGQAEAASAVTQQDVTPARYVNFKIRLQ